MRRALLAGLVVVILVACSSGLRDDELGCEEAAAHLEACCAEVEASMFECNYTRGACGRGHPEMPVATSRCIRGKSCAELEAEGICDDGRLGGRLQCT